MKIEEKILRGWGGENVYYVKGYCYLVVDIDLEVFRVFFLGKVVIFVKVMFFIL